MKTIYLLFLTALIFSCRPASYVPTMPNEPMFTKPLEAQAGVALGFDHIEAQGAVSLLPFAGVSAGFYKGKRKTEITEYGINLFSPITKRNDFFAGLSFGRGAGKFYRNYRLRYYNSGESYFIKSNFTTFYLQPSVYYTYNLRDIGRFKFGFSLKHQEINFNDFKIEYKSRSITSADNFEIHEKKDKGYGVTETPFVSCHFKPDAAPFYCLFQAGYTFVTNKFSTELVNSFGSSGRSNNPLSSIEHPLFTAGYLIFLLVLKLINYEKHLPGYCDCIIVILLPGPIYIH